MIKHTQNIRREIADELFECLTILWVKETRATTTDMFLVTLALSSFAGFHCLSSV